MGIEKIGGNVEKISAESPEKNTNQIESMDYFIKSLEDTESNSPYDKTEINPVMKPEVRDDVPGFEGRDVLVCGNPMETGENLNHNQGNNPYKLCGDCGLVSTSNVLNLCGQTEVDETAIVEHAIKHGECHYDSYTPPVDCGGVRAENVQNILEDFGVEAEIVAPDDKNGDIESIAESLEKGHVGVMCINSCVLWDDPDFFGDGCCADHAVTLTGTVRDVKTGELLAFTVCDSGDGQACHVVPVEQMRECYENAFNSSAIISAEPVRKI